MAATSLAEQVGVAPAYSGKSYLCHCHARDQHHDVVGNL